MRWVCPPFLLTLSVPLLCACAEQVRLCKSKIDAVLDRAREELPPLPPPLTSGWRPVPSVGGQQEEYVSDHGMKRPRDDAEAGHQSRDQRGPPPPPGSGYGQPPGGGGYGGGGYGGALIDAPALTVAP